MTIKEKIEGIIYDRQLCSMMNNTKWQKLLKGIGNLSFPPPYTMKLLTDTEYNLILEDNWYLGDWSMETLPPFYMEEWLCIRPRYLLHRGRLILDDIADETEEFRLLLDNNFIPYEERAGSFIVYGYKNNKLQYE